MHSKSYSLNKYFLLLVIGINNGLPPLLIGSTLYVWLHEYGINIKIIGLYSLSGLPFFFSFLMSSTLEQLGFYKWFSYKRFWQINIILCSTLILLIPMVISNKGLLFSICLAINVLSVINAILAQSIQKTLFNGQKIAASINILTLGYRVGMIIAGSLALYFSVSFTWAVIYRFLALIGFLCSFLINFYDGTLFDLKDPTQALPTKSLSQRILDSYRSLFKVKGIVLILLLMFWYRAPDNLITHYFNLYYLSLGVSKAKVAFGYKFYGLVMSTIGGFICVIMIKKWGYIKSLMTGLILHLLAYVALYISALSHVVPRFFYGLVSFEEFTRGIAMVIFWSLQLYICKRQHLLVQISILTGLDALSNSLLGAGGGAIISYLGYSNFIGVVILSFIPAILIVKSLKKYSYL